jgi:putative modified peptide
MNDPGRGQICVTTTLQQASELLHKLAEDDAFRSRYETDTVALLAEYGIEVPPDRLPERVVAPPAISLRPAAAAVDAALAGDDEGEGFSFLWGFAFISFIGPHSFRGFADSSFRGPQPG